MALSIQWALKCSNGFVRVRSWGFILFSDCLMSKGPSATRQKTMNFIRKTSPLAHQNRKLTEQEHLRWEFPCSQWQSKCMCILLTGCAYNNRALRALMGRSKTVVHEEASKRPGCQRYMYMWVPGKVSSFITGCLPLLVQALTMLLLI